MAKEALYVICESLDFKEELQASVSAANGRAVHFVTDLPAQPDNHPLLFECEKMEGKNLEHFLRYALASKQRKLLAFTNQIPVYVYQKIVRLKNIAIMQKPREAQTVFAVLEEMEKSGEVKPTSFPRFLADLPVRMVVLNSGLLVPSRMKNYSAGGAFLEYRGISLKEGDKLQIAMGESKNNQFQAKVIWVRRSKEKPLAPGVGIQFINT